MNPTVVSCLVVLALILIEALFVAAEIALVSLRESQVQQLAESGRRGAVVARLVRDPNRFLATVQIGVTLTALLSSAYGATTLSEDAKRGLESAGLSSGLAGFAGLVGVTMIISFVTLVIGELAPKRLAMQRIEPTARAVAPFLNGMSRLCRPVIWLLSVCTDGVVRMFGGDPSAAREQVSEAELRRMVATSDSLSTDERRLIDEVFGAGDRQLREVLVPRTEVVFLDGATSVRVAATAIAGHPHSRYPVIDQSADNVVGFVHVRDLLSPGALERGGNVAALARPALFLPSTKHVLDALSEMRRDSFHLAIVVDEYGGTAGIVTLEDLVEEVIGDIRDEYDSARADVIRLRGGELDLSGLVNLDEAAEEIGAELPEGPYETLAGFLISQLGRMPRVGDVVVHDSLRFTVHAMDGRRVSRVRIAAITGAAEAEAGGDGVGGDVSGGDGGAGADAAEAAFAEPVETGADRAGSAADQAGSSAGSVPGPELGAANQAAAEPVIAPQ